MGIRVRKKHGVNPSLSKCFFCGEVHEIILFGLLPEDKEAPREIVLSYDPCEKCRELFSTGCLFIGVSEKPLHEGHLPIQEGFFPTGSYALISRESVHQYGVDAPVVLIDKIPESWGG